MNPTKRWERSDFDVNGAQLRQNAAVGWMRLKGEICNWRGRAYAWIIIDLTVSDAQLRLSYDNLRSCSSGISLHGIGLLRGGSAISVVGTPTAYIRASRSPPKLFVICPILPELAPTYI